MKIEYKNQEGRRYILDIKPKSVFTEERKWMLKAFDNTGKIEQDFLFENIQRAFSDIQKQRISCVTTYVVNEQSEFLFIYHNKLKKWVPPGGKIDNEETPEEAAIRETYEETGIRVRLIAANDSPSNVIPPFGVQLNPIIEGKIDHVDYIYLAHAMNDEVKIDINEAKEFGWYTLKQITELETFDSVKSWCSYFSKTILNFGEKK